MNTKKIKRRKNSEAEIEPLNRGDMASHKKEFKSPTPHDRGDLKRNKERPEQDNKKNKPKSIKIHIDLASKAVDTFEEFDEPVSFENPDNNNLDVAPDDVDFRKRIKDRYTFRLPKKDPRKVEDTSKLNVDMQSYAKNDQPPRCETLGRKQMNDENNKFYETKPSLKTILPTHRAGSAIKIKQIIKSKDKDDLVDNKKECPETEKTKDAKKTPSRNRKPEIRTITSKMNTRVYKAVTFVEQKQQKSLQIRIPTKEAKLKAPSRSKIPVSVRPIQTNNPILSKRRPSPGKRRLKRNVTPKTSRKSIDSIPEVAKWAPESINQHTKPYYEAWVNKTLTATPKYSKKYKDYFDKNKVLQALREMRRERSSELMQENYEQYAGKILVRQRSKQVKKSDLVK